MSVTEDPTAPSTAATRRELANSFTAVAKSLIAARSLEEAFDSIVALAVTTVRGAEEAGITLRRRGRFDTPTATGELPRRVDAIQYELSSGPCVDAVVDNEVYITGDLSADARWPEFGARAAAETGVLSMMAFRLLLEDDDTVAGLNLYSTHRAAFDESSALNGTVLATHAAIAIAAASRKEHITNLEQALTSNREIGIAVGVLMASQLLSRDEAFALLRVASQHTHRKLREVAHDVAESGILELPTM